MDATISGGQAAAYGDVPGAVATPTGVDVPDAAYHTAHRFPGGVPALAQRMGMSANTLQHKVNPRVVTHHLSLAEAVTMQLMADDASVLHAMAWELGYVCVRATQSNGATLAQVMHMAKEFGEVLGAVNEAVADGNVTPNEMRQCEGQAAELIGAVNCLLSAVRGMMPVQREALQR